MTIFDRLEERGVSWKFYVQNYEPALTYRTLERYQGNRASQVIWVPLLAMDRFIDDPKLAGKIVDLSEYFKDLENGTLPAVAYVVPSGASEHPPGSLMSGQRFVVSLLNSLQRSDYWEKSAFFLTYDDWGGWYDHVPPEQIDKYGYGFRVPSMLISPYARRGYVEHEVLDFTSILKFIEENWGVDPLSDRDLNAKSIAGGFDFGQAPRAPFFISGLPPDPPRPEPPRTVILLGYGSALVFPLLLIAWTLRSGRAKTGAASPATTPTRLEDTQP
jgi:phospholipase C